MQTVTVTFENKEYIFDVYSRKELDRKEFMSLITDNGPRAARIGSEEWQDADTYRIEKLAAQVAGLDGQVVITVRK
jgi:hypothetical protein